MRTAHPFGARIRGLAVVSTVGLLGACADFTAPARPTTGASRDVSAASAEGAGAPAQVFLVAYSARLPRDAQDRFEAIVWDAQNRPVTAPALVWQSSAPEVATVLPNGVVVGRGVGRARITARAGSQAGAPSASVEIMIEPRASVVVPEIVPSAATLDVGVGRSVPLTFGAVGAGGRPVASCRWWTAATDPSVATYTNGLVRGVRSGVTTVVASCDGRRFASVPVSVGVPVIVPEVPSAVHVLPEAPVVTLGSALRLVATPVAASGQPLPAHAVSWRSAAADVATVDSAGTVTPLAAGQTAITVTVDGAAATVLLTVVAPQDPNATSSGTASTPSTPTTSTQPATPTSPTAPTSPVIPAPPTPPAALSDSVALAVQRFDGGSGSALVSNGIPLAPGRLTEAQLSRVRVMVDGREVPIALTPLAGRFSDGSLRSVLVQFRYDVPATGTVPAAIVFNSTRSTTDIAPTTGSQHSLVVALPTSAEYLTATSVGGQLLPMTVQSAFGSWDSDYQTISDHIWATRGPGTSRAGAGLYEHVLMAYQWWLRTGSPTAWHRANRTAAAYVAWLDQAAYQAPPWMSNTEGLVIHYYVTGDPSIRIGIGRLANQMCDVTRDGFNEYDGAGYETRLGGTAGDDRSRARTLQAMIDATIVQAPYGTRYMAGSLEKGMNDILSTQHADGSFGGTWYLGGQKNFMVGMLLSALVRYHEEISPDARIPGALKRAVDNMWATSWVASAGGFKYVSVDSTREGTRQSNPEPGLNGLILPAFSYVAYQTGNSLYQGYLTDILAGSRRNRPNWSNWATQFDQAYFHLFNHFARHEGVRVARSGSVARAVRR